MNKQEIKKEFKNLVKQNKLDIFSIENLMIDNVERYKEQLSQEIECLLNQMVDENKIIVKKNKNGKILDIVFTTKEKKN